MTLIYTEVLLLLLNFLFLFKELFRKRPPNSFIHTFLFFTFLVHCALFNL